MLKYANQFGCEGGGGGGEGGEGVAAGDGGSFSVGLTDRELRGEG